MLHVAHPSLRSASEPVEESVPALVYPYRAGLIGGALGGLAMIAVAAIGALVSGGGFWLPLNLIGAALVLHLAISAGLGLVFAMLLPTLPGSPVIWSLAVGGLLWGLAGLIGLPMLNLIIEQAVDVPSLLMAHLAYGLVLGGWIARTPKVRAE